MRLEYRDLVFEYPGMPGEAPTRAVNGLSGGLSTGEMQAVIGPNGAGKSTLVKLLAALEEAGEGSVLFDGSP
ncbi:MAG: ABC-type multidrug transport system ATPase subunit, partial [Planctomycetota bacterium]